MSTDVKSCYIYTESRDKSPIYLANNVPVIIGRDEKTQITDLKCSRKQVRLCANYETKQVTVQQIGSRACGYNGAKTIKGEKYLARHGDSLEIIYGKYPYKIEFLPPPQNDHCKQITSVKKRSCIDVDSDDEIESIETPSKRSKVDSDDNSQQSEKKMATDTSDLDVLKTPREAKELKDLFGKPIKGSQSNGTWTEIDEQALLIFTSNGVEGSEKIAAYDMDNTLITTQSGKVFPKDHNDWKLLLPNIPKKLEKLFNEGFKIVIFTNQRGIGLGKSRSSDFMKKIEKVVNKLGIPIQVFIALKRDKHRKPMIGMWESLVNANNNNIPVDKNQSFFVGDAAGRPKDWTLHAKKDHASVDRLFAINLGLKFQTPEEHFFGHKPATFVLPEFNPKNFNPHQQLFDPPVKLKPNSAPEVIIMVGCPASGKSHVAKNHLKDYHHINRDKLGSWQKCVSATEEKLKNGHSVVIDNTNPDVASRKRFVDVAKSRSAPVRCFVMSTTIEHAKHNNRFRELTDPDHMVITDAVIHTYMKSYEEPTTDEGCSEIVKVNFVPHFDSDQHRQWYEMYLLEK